ncbi:glutathione S-transferase family protein [Litoribacillus peritrichatus]|uniref:Glutathione S-transferase family protein n=1 Tax=Litoribacillus peritrichatus TaxID=718191 RepID=A0ABP7M7R6_9GAMM
MIKVYGYPKTRATRIVWLLEEMGIDYQYCLVDFAKGESQSPEFLKVNPAGKVPAVEMDGFVMIESGAIVTHLADKYSAGELIPETGTAERARYEQWSYFALTELEQPLWTLGKHKFALPKKYRVEAALPTAAWEFQKALKLLSEGLGDKQYMLGDKFTAVDILMAQTLRWGINFKQPVEQENLLAYLEQVESRPAREKALQREAAEASA